MAPLSPSTPPAPLIASATPLFPNAPHGLRLLPLHLARHAARELAALEIREITPENRAILAAFRGPRGLRVSITRATAFDPDQVAIVAFRGQLPAWDALTGEPPFQLEVG